MLPLQLVIFLCFICFLFIFYTLTSLIIEKSKPVERIKKYLKHERKPLKNEIYKDALSKEKKDFRILLKVLGNRISKGSMLKNHNKKMGIELEGADILLKSEELTGICMLSCLVAFFMLYLITTNFFISIILSLVFWNIPIMFVKSKKNSRIREIGDQLGDTLALLSNSLKAGYSFLQAVEAVSKDMQPPISREFSKLLKEINYGLTTEEALMNFLGRVKNEDIEMMVTAVLIQRQIGGNLAEILDSISSTIRERVRMKGEIKALTAQGRISGIVISGLPFAIGLLIYIMNPEYILRLFNHPIGLAMIGAGLMSEFIGVMLIKKIVNIKV